MRINWDAFEAWLSCLREELHKADQLPPASMPWLNGSASRAEEDRAMTDTAPTDAEVAQLEQDMEAAFHARDRHCEVWKETGEAAYEQQADMWDREADRLLTQYNAACQAQRAESDERRDVNVARHERDQNVKRGDLAAALKGDDWLEDHGMHADERATCHQCQSWADHAHDQITNQRITLEQWEGRTPDLHLDMPPAPSDFTTRTPEREQP